MSAEEARAVVEAIKSDPEALDALARALWPVLEEVDDEAQHDEAHMRHAAHGEWRRKWALPMPD